MELYPGDVFISVKSGTTIKLWEVGRNWCVVSFKNNPRSTKMNSGEFPRRAIEMEIEKGNWVKQEDSFEFPDEPPTYVSVLHDN